MLRQRKNAAHKNTVGDMNVAYLAAVFIKTSSPRPTSILPNVETTGKAEASISEAAAKLAESTEQKTTTEEMITALFFTSLTS